MRIVHLIKTAVGATWALRQIAELVKRGVEVHVILPNGPLVQQYVDCGAKVHLLQTSINIKNPFKNIKLFREFRLLIRNIGPDLIHSHFYSTTLTMRLALRSVAIPRIFQVPGPLHLEHYFFRKLELLISQDNDYWLASCKWTMDCYIRSGIAPFKVGLAYYGVDVNKFKPGKSGKLRSIIGIGNDTPLVGMVSYFYAPKYFLGQTRGLKGHEDLIDAVELSAQLLDNLHCVFIGSAWAGADSYMDKVIEYASKKKFGKFVFLGFRNDVQDLYSDFDLAIHPSHSENLGGAAESMLCGVPTLATNLGGFPDLIKLDRTGWLVQRKNPKELSKSIISALSNPLLSKKLSTAGRRFARRLLNINSTTDSVIDFYKKII